MHIDKCNVWDEFDFKEAICKNDVTIFFADFIIFKGMDGT